jgi:tripartite-type tricarboxylate transporter receptor subunit TctC
MKMAFQALAVGAALATALVSHAAADSVSDFYKGKTVTVVVGTEIGTGFDIYARTLARHLGRHIPGQPNLVVQNMLGAGGIAASNWLYNVAPRDGSVLATYVHTAPFEPLMGNSVAKYDAAKLTWIGNMESTVGICGVSKNSGIERFEDLLTKETIFGATGLSGAIAKQTLAVRSLFDLKIKLALGYQGSGSIKLAMQRREVSGICSLSMSTVAAAWKDDFDSGALRPILQLSGESHPDLKDIPHIRDLAKSKEDSQVIGLIFGTQALGRLYVSAPAVPIDRRNALRAGFTATMKDPQFLSDAAKSRIEISPMAGADVEALVARIFASSPDVVERMKVAVRPD